MRRLSDFNKRVQKQSEKRGFEMLTEYKAWQEFERPCEISKSVRSAGAANH